MTGNFFSRLRAVRSALAASRYDFRPQGSSSSLKERSVRGSAITLVSQLLKIGLTIVSTAVLARILTPADFGLVAMTTSVMGLAFLFKDLGLTTATIQYKELTHRIVSTIFWLNLVFATLLSLFVIAIAPLIAEFFSEPRVEGLTIAFGCLLIVGAASNQHQALLERRMQFFHLAVVEISASVAAIAVAIVVALAGWGYWSLFVLPATQSLVGTVLIWLSAGWRPGLPERSQEVGRMIRFGGELTGFGLINYLGRNLDNVLIGRVWGSGQLGLYSKAYRLLLFPLQQVNAPVARVMVPALSELQGDGPRYRSAYLRSLQTVAAVSVPAFVFLAATSDWVILLALGEQWVGASPIFAWLAAAGVFQIVGNSTGWLFVSQGRTREMLIWGFVGTGITVASFVIGLPHRAEGVAAAYAIAGVLLRSPLLFWYVGRKGPVRTMDLYRSLGFPAAQAVAVFTMVAILRWVLPPVAPVVGLAVCGACALMVYALGLSTPVGRKTRSNVQDFVATLKRGKMDPA